MDDKEFLEKYDKVENNIRETQKLLEQAKTDWANEVKTLAEQKNLEKRGVLNKEIADKYAKIMFTLDKKLEYFLSEEADLLADRDEK